jgi:seryl-tRNA synthetase
VSTVLDALADVGLRWHPSGQASLSGPLLRLAAQCDHAFLMLASLWDAQEETHPATLPVADLARAGYLRSFPHQATFAVHLDREADNLDRFVTAVRADDEQIELARTASVREVLTPAACYHVYQSRQGARLDAAAYVTTRNTCFRTEDAYMPLHRQRAFTMREIVCLGPAAQVDAFLERGLLVAQSLIGELDLPTDWVLATDPFFRPAENPGYLMQLVTPVKREAVYLVGGTSTLAIASVNRHGDHFGEAFAIEVAGEPTTSGCVAFGLERWLLAITDRHGADPDRWPNPAQAAARVLKHHG